MSIKRPLYCRLQTTNTRRPDVCAFLRHLRGAVVGPWDHPRTHKGPSIQDLPRTFPRRHLEFFPAYAPELNPGEGAKILAKAALGVAHEGPTAARTPPTRAPVVSFTLDPPS